MYEEIILAILRVFARSLDRRLRHFGIFYSNRDVTVDDVRQPVSKELDGPGKLLGYRAIQKKIRQEYELNVPRDLVHAVMYDLDPEGLEASGVGAKKRKPRGHFTTKGPRQAHGVPEQYLSSRHIRLHRHGKSEAFVTSYVGLKLLSTVSWSLVPRVPVRDENHCVLHENGQRF